ncbi:MAG TPA: hypothetical protein VKV79_05835, partial [Terriglobia bacterium]|nr:hypothetical protein [Terriglobia bacterium]
MNIEEKVRKTLEELHAEDAAAVEALFDEVRGVMEDERQRLVSYGARDEVERQSLAKALRDRWLARKNGLLAHADENWLKKAPSQLKPAVGKQFNELRRAAMACEIAELVKEIPVQRAKLSPLEAFDEGTFQFSK